MGCVYGSLLDATVSWLLTLCLFAMSSGPPPKRLCQSVLCFSQSLLHLERYQRSPQTYSIYTYISTTAYIHRETINDKTACKSHRNAPNCNILRVNWKKFSGEGHSPLSRPPPLRGGSHSAPQLSRLRRSAPHIFFCNSTIGEREGRKAEIFSGAVLALARWGPMGYQGVATFPAGGGVPHRTIQ